MAPSSVEIVRKACWVLAVGIASEACGGHVKSTSNDGGSAGSISAASGADGVGAAGPAGGGTTSQYAAPTDEVGLLREVQGFCDRILTVPCASDADGAGCLYNGRRLIEEATYAGCLQQAVAVFNCVGRAGTVCGEEGHPDAPGCAGVVSAVNDCILKATNWDALGCGSSHYPGPDGMSASCEVTCGNLAAACERGEAAMICTCSNGPNVGSQFSSPDCPRAKAIAAGCNFERLP